LPPGLIFDNPVCPVSRWGWQPRRLGGHRSCRVTDDHSLTSFTPC
jgi:hypothetical protein